MGEHEVESRGSSVTRRALLRGGIGALVVAAGGLVGCDAPWEGVLSPPTPTLVPTARPTSTPIPTPVPTPARRLVPPPTITARGAIVWDATRRVELFAKAPDARVIPASTTKIMTALLVLEGAPLDRLVRIERADLALPDDVSRMGTPPGDELAPGDLLTIEDLLYGMLVASGADAARAAARTIGTALLAGQTGDPLARFVREMNARVAAWGLQNTHFSNPDGNEEEGHYSSARDLMTIADRALANPTFAAIVATKATTRRTRDGRKTFALENTNQLLRTRAGVHGVKTGTAGANLEWECLIAAQWTATGRILAVVLGSNQGQRYADTVALLDWANRG